MKIACIAMAFTITGVLLAILSRIECSNLLQSSGRNNNKMKANLTVALILPRTNFGKRGYTRAINEALQSLQKTRGPKFEFFNAYGPLQVRNEMMSLTPSPTGKFSQCHVMCQCLSELLITSSEKGKAIKWFLSLRRGILCKSFRVEYSPVSILQWSFGPG